MCYVRVSVLSDKMSKTIGTLYLAPSYCSHRLLIEVSLKGPQYLIPVVIATEDLTEQKMYLWTIVGVFEDADYKDPHGPPRTYTDILEHNY